MTSNDMKWTKQYLICCAGHPSVVADSLETALAVAGDRLRRMAQDNATIVEHGISIVPIDHCTPESPVKLFESLLPSLDKLELVKATRFKTELVGRVDASPTDPLTIADGEWPEPESHEQA